MNRRRSRRDRDRPDLHGPRRAAPYPMPETRIDVFAKARTHERARAAAAAREADVLPYFRLLEGPARPVVEMEGAERIMLGSNNYLGLTARRARQAAAPATRWSATARASRARACSTARSRCTSSSSASSPSGWAPRTRSCSRPATRPTSARSATMLAPGDTVIADRGDHASILDGCLLSRAKLRPFRHNRLDKLERDAGARRRATAAASWSSSTASSRWRATSRRCPRSATLCERYGARLMVDEAHGAGVLGARGAGACRTARRRGPRRPAHGHLLQVAGGLRRLRRRPGRRHRLPAHRSRAPSCSPPRRCLRPSARRSPRCGSCRSDEGPALLRAVLDNAR